MRDYVAELMAEVKVKNPAEPEFHQAVQEVVDSLSIVLEQHPEYRHEKILQRIIEPERVIMFRVPWRDDQGNLHVNRGFRIQMNSAIGPYKGGLRFHPTVNLSILKFLVFEQGLKNEFTGVMTGKGLTWGGSVIRPEATGYGAVYFAEEMLKTRKEDLKGKIALVSGSGNVAQYTVEKLNSLGAKPVTLSDSTGFIYDEDGITREKLAFVMELKNVRRGRISEYAVKFKGTVFTPVDPTLDHNPLWNTKAQCAFPSATQNEINEKDADNLLKNGVYVVSEGANMPTTIEGVHRFLQAGILYGPGKAANAGGVATSGLEMAQNSMRISWTREEVDARLY